MFIKKRILKAERKIAGLESQLQSQQERISRIEDSTIHRLVHPGEVVRSVLKDSHNSTFRVNLNRKKLFEPTSEQKR